jgi:hypothetical protein
MKKLLFLLLAAGLVLSFGATHAAAQTAATSTLQGKAVRWNGEPIAGATIAALRGPLESDPEVASTVTAADGSYSLTVPAGATYWLHIRTFGTYWGYSYHVPFTPRADETISQIYFALGPRDVKDAITLPTPESNVGPETGTDEPPAVQPPAPPAPQATATPVSRVKPIIGANPAPQPGRLPDTGVSDGETLGLTTVLILAGLGLVGLGLSCQALVRRQG